MVRERRETRPDRRDLLPRGSAASRLSPPISTPRTSRRALPPPDRITRPLGLLRETVFAAAAIAREAKVPVVLDRTCVSSSGSREEARATLRDLAQQPTSSSPARRGRVPDREPTRRPPRALCWTTRPRSRSSSSSSARRDRSPSAARVASTFLDAAAALITGRRGRRLRRGFYAGQLRGFDSPPASLATAAAWPPPRPRCRRLPAGGSRLGGGAPDVRR